MWDTFTPILNILYGLGEGWCLSRVSRTQNGNVRNAPTHSGQWPALFTHRLSLTSHYRSWQHEAFLRYHIWFLLVKGIVHPKMKIQSLSTHHDADGGVGEVLTPQNTTGVTGVNSVAAKSNTIEVAGCCVYVRAHTPPQAPTQEARDEVSEKSR